MKVALLKDVACRGQIESATAFCSRLPSQSKNLELSAPAGAIPTTWTTPVRTFLAYNILSEARCSVVEFYSEVDGSDVVTEESVGSSAFPAWRGRWRTQFRWLTEGCDAHLRGCRLWDRRRVETIQHHVHLDVSGSISTVGSAIGSCALRGPAL